MKLNNSESVNYVYDVYCQRVSSKDDVVNILNDKTKITGDVVSVILHDNNLLLVTFKRPETPKTQSTGKIVLKKNK